MPSAFISYRRVDSASLATLIAVRLKEVHGIDAYIDTRNTDGGGPFPDRLRGAIERMDVFVCLLGATTLDSAWVQVEIEHAHNLRKTMIPVFQERYVAPSPIPNQNVEALLQSDGVQFLDVRNLYIDQAIAQLAEMIKNSAPHPTVTLSPSLTKTPFYRRQIFLISLIALIVFLFIAIIVPALNPSRPTLIPATNAALNPSDTIVPTQPKATATSTITVTPEPTLTSSPTLEIAFIVHTLDSQATVEQATKNAQSTDVARATAYGVGTQSMIDQTVTATRWTPTSTPNITASIEAYRTWQAATSTSNFFVGLTVTATLWTATPTRTITPTPIPLGFPGNPVTKNTEWYPVHQTFDDVVMVLVPVGCFMMGSDNGSDDETPLTKQCIQKPFWIDKTEVTNQQYGSEGTFKGDSYPRDSVTWFQARDFCTAHNKRLSTELEWEYAARGPSNLIYPWGSNFVPSNAVYFNNSNNQSAEVGSRPIGNSWVGASDLSGNVWEWVSSIYRPYPYKADDGREADNDSMDVRRVLRGGSWFNDESDVRAAYRFSINPSTSNYRIGFRCARSS